MQAIGIVGLCGVGKTTLANMLTSRYEYECIHFGAAVLAELEKRGLQTTSTNERTVREELRAKYGMEALALLNYPGVIELLSNNRGVAIDGIYSMAEYDFLRDRLYDNLTLLAIHTPRAVRKRRLSERPIRPLTPQEVDERDYLEVTNLDKAGPIAIADYHILNDSSLSILVERLEAIMQAIISK